MFRNSKTRVAAWSVAKCPLFDKTFLSEENHQNSNCI